MIELNESMVSDLHQFNNCGSFTITINGTAYSVKYSNANKEIQTDAPKDIKEAIREWWFV